MCVIDLYTTKASNRNLTKKKEMGKRTVAAELFKLLENVAVSTKAHQSSVDSQLQHTPRNIVRVRLRRERETN